MYPFSPKLPSHPGYIQSSRCYTIGSCWLSILKNSSMYMSIPDSLTILSFEINNLYIPFLPKCLLFWMVNSKRYSLNEWSKVPGEPRQAHTLLSLYYCPQIPFKQKPASEWSDLTPSVMRNKILTVSQLGPCSNGVPFGNPLWCLKPLANFTLAASSPSSAPGGRAHKRLGA